MVYRKTLCDLRKETDIDYNDEKQIETAIYNANFAINCLCDIKYENKDFLKNNLLLSLKTIKDLLKSNSQILKYKKDIIVLKSRLLELNLSDYIKNLSEDDFIYLFETLNEICLLEMNISINAKRKTLKTEDISYKDEGYYHLNNKKDRVIISRPAYIAARAKNDIKYGTYYVGSKILNGASKTLNIVKKNKSI